MVAAYRPSWLIVRALIAAATLVANPVLAAEPWTVEGRVVGISDGDTITILDRDKRQHKIRLAGIDAPEKGQAFGDRSKESLSRLVFDRQVEAHCHKRDRYGREVCKIMRGSTDVNIEQVRAGMAWWYQEYATMRVQLGAACGRTQSRCRHGSGGYGRPAEP